MAAGLFLNPASGSFLVGSTFDLSIVLDTKAQPVNTVEIELLFPPEKLQVSNPPVGQSIIQLWPAPPVFSNRQGHGLDSHRPPTETLGNAPQDTLVHLIESVFINLEHG